MIDDAQGFYPSDSWAVAIDGFLELGGQIRTWEPHQQVEYHSDWDSASMTGLPYGISLHVGVTRINAQVFGDRYVEVGYPANPSKGWSGPMQIVRWTGGRWDFSDAVWHAMGLILRGEIPHPRDVELVYHEQRLERSSWRETRRNWTWVHSQYADYPVCRSCGSSLRGDVHLVHSGHCFTITNLGTDIPTTPPVSAEPK